MEHGMYFIWRALNDQTKYKYIVCTIKQLNKYPSYLITRLKICLLSFIYTLYMLIIPVELVWATLIG